MSPTLTQEPQCFLVFPRISIYSNPVSKQPKVPLGKDWKKANSTNFRHFIKVFPWQNWVIPSFKGFWVYKLPQVWDLVNTPRFLFVMIRFSLSFFCLRISLLIRLKQKCNRFFLVFFFNLFHFWNHHNSPASTKGPYKSHHHKSHYACAVMGQALLDMALSISPITITRITLPLGFSAATWPLLLCGPTEHQHLQP